MSTNPLTKGYSILMKFGGNTSIPDEIKRNHIEAKRYADYIRKFFKEPKSLAVKGFETKTYKSVITYKYGGGFKDFPASYVMVKE